MELDEEKPTEFDMTKNNSSQESRCKLSFASLCSFGLRDAANNSHDGRKLSTVTNARSSTVETPGEYDALDELWKASGPYIHEPDDGYWLEHITDRKTASQCPVQLDADKDEKVFHDSADSDTKLHIKREKPADDFNKCQWNGYNSVEFFYAADVGGGLRDSEEQHSSDFQVNPSPTAAADQRMMTTRRPTQSCSRQSQNTNAKSDELCDTLKCKNIRMEFANQCVDSFAHALSAAGRNEVKRELEADFTPPSVRNSLSANNEEQLQTTDDKRKQHSVETRTLQPDELMLHGLTTRPSSSANNDIQRRRHLGEKQYACPCCMKRFRSQFLVVVHMRVHTGEKPFKCIQCEKTFTLLGNLQRHKRVHTGERPFQCLQCEKAFACRDSLKRHYRVHTGEKPYHCIECAKTFTLIGNLKRHMRVHTGERPFHCLQCDKSFAEFDKLKRHMRVHTGERPFQCQHCEKTFAQRDSLKRHLTVHSDENPFRCVQRKKSFADSSDLKCFQSVERPSQCPQCGQRFTASGHVKRHMRIHTGEKPFKCPLCDKTFSQSGNMKRHARSHDKQSTSSDQQVSSGTPRHLTASVARLKRKQPDSSWCCPENSQRIAHSDAYSQFSDVKREPKTEYSPDELPEEKPSVDDNPFAEQKHPIQNRDDSKVFFPPTGAPAGDELSTTFQLPVCGKSFDEDVKPICSEREPTENRCQQNDLHRCTANRIPPL